MPTFQSRQFYDPNSGKARGPRIPVMAKFYLMACSVEVMWQTLKTTGTVLKIIHPSFPSGIVEEKGGSVQFSPSQYLQPHNSRWTLLLMYHEIKKNSPQERKINTRILESLLLWALLRHPVFPLDFDSSLLRFVTNCTIRQTMPPLLLRLSSPNSVYGSRWRCNAGRVRKRGIPERCHGSIKSSRVGLWGLWESWVVVWSSLMKIEGVELKWHQLHLVES